MLSSSNRIYVLLYFPSQPKQPIAPHRVTSVRAAARFPTSLPKSFFFPLSLSHAPWKGNKRDPDNIPTSLIMVGSYFWEITLDVVRCEFSKKIGSREFLQKRKGVTFKVHEKKILIHQPLLFFHTLNNYVSYSCHKSKMIPYAVIIPTNITSFYCNNAHFPFSLGMSFRGQPFRPF